MKWDVGKLQPRTVEIQASNDGETWAYVTEWVDLSGFRYVRTAPAVTVPDRSGCLWFCGMDDDAIMFDDRRAGYNAPPGRVFYRGDLGKSYCTEACRCAEVGPLPPKPYGHTKLAEGGPSAVATAPAREPWAPSVCELDLLPDAGR
jgi:hypothetical protein